MPDIRVCAVNGTNTASLSASSRPRMPYFSFASTTIDRPSGVSSASDDSCAASASSCGLTPGSATNSVACRLPNVIVPVLSSSSVCTSPAASTARPDIASTLRCTSRSMPGDADRRQQSADGRRNQADQQRDEHEDRLRRARVDREGLQRDHRQQEDDRQPGQQDVERDLVRRLLPRGAFDERDHPIQERVTRIRGDADLDPVRQHLRAAGHRRSVAARFADDRRRLAGDRRLVHRRDAFDDFAVGGDELARLDHHHVVLAEARGRDDLGPAAGADPVGHRLGPRLAQRVRLRLAAAFRHGFGEVREQHGQPQPERDLELEAEPGPAGDGIEDEPHAWSARCRPRRRT